MIPVNSACEQLIGIGNVQCEQLLGIEESRIQIKEQREKAQLSVAVKMKPHAAPKVDVQEDGCGTV